MNDSMHQISATLADLDAMLESLDDVDELAADTLLAALEAAVGTAQEKAVRVARFILHLEQMAAVAKAKAARLQELAKRRATRADTLRRGLLEMLQAAGLQRIEEPDVVLRVQRGGGVGRLVVSVDVATLESSPLLEGYLRRDPTIDNAALRAAAAAAGGVLTFGEGDSSVELARIEPPRPILVIK